MLSIAICTKKLANRSSLKYNVLVVRIMKNIELKMPERPIYVDVFNEDGKNGYRSMWDYHCHDYYEFSFIINGSLTVLLENAAYNACDGCLILSPPFLDHYFINAENTRYYRKNILFIPECLNDLPQYSRYINDLFGKKGAVIRLDAEEIDVIDRLVTMLQAEKEISVKKLLLALILHTAGKCNAVLKKSQDIGIDDYIVDVLRYIAENYDKRLTAEEIAHRFFVSRTKLMIDFKMGTGKTLCAHITAIRIERAKALLRAGKSVAETSISCGFGNSCNFIRVFKNHVGQTPKQFCLNYDKPI